MFSLTHARQGAEHFPVSDSSKDSEGKIPLNAGEYGRTSSMNRDRVYMVCPTLIDEDCLDYPVVLSKASQKNIATAETGNPPYHGSPYGPANSGSMDERY